MIYIAVDTTPETLLTAPHVASKFDRNIKPENICNFTKDNFLKNCNENDLEEIVFHGHADHLVFGEYDAEDFVRRFVKNFKLRFENPEDFKRVKLVTGIGCELGLIKDNRSLFQEIIDGLYDAGFTNIIGHSIVQDEREAMRVNIIHESNLGIFGLEPGDVLAYWMTLKQEEELYSLKDDKEAQRSFERKLKEQQQYFLESRNIRNDLYKKEFVVFPSQRKAMENEEKLNAIIYIHQRLNYENFMPKKSNKTILELQALLDKLNNIYGKSDSWKEEVAITAEKLPRWSTTRKLLLAIVESDQKTILSIIKEKQEKKAVTQEYRNRLGSESYAHIGADLGFKNRKKKNTHNAKKEQHRDRAQQSLVKGQQEKNSSSNQDGANKSPSSHRSESKDVRQRRATQIRAKYLGDEEQKCDLIKDSIDLYINQLQDEAKEHCCLSLFGYLGNYKLRKFQKLSHAIRDDKDVEAIQDKTKRIYHDSWFLTKGTSSHRAKNLITHILHNDTGKGFDEEPYAPLNRDDFKITKL